MKHNQNNNRIKHQILKGNIFLKGGINNINQTNINNNINITNYYSLPSKNNINQKAISSTNKTNILKNIINNPIKTTTHRAKKIYNASPPYQRYQQCRSPYIKKILPNTNRYKSQDRNIFETSPSMEYIKINKIEIDDNHFYDNLTFNNKNKNNNIVIIQKKSINKLQKNRSYKTKNFLYLNNNILFDENQIDFNYNKTNKTKQIIDFDKPLSKFDSNSNKIIFNINKKSNISSHNKKESIMHSYQNSSPLLIIKNDKDMNKVYKKENNIENIFVKYIIIIQSNIRRFLIRIKFREYITLIKKMNLLIHIIKVIYIKKNKYLFFSILKYTINNRKKEIEVNSKFFPLKQYNFEFIHPNNNTKYNEIQKELNRKNLDYKILENRINELILENKEIKNMNNIIKNENEQLMLNIQNYRNNIFNNLKLTNNHFAINQIEKFDNKTRKNNIILKYINKKESITKLLLFKYFYKFLMKSKSNKFIDKYDIDKSFHIISELKTKLKNIFLKNNFKNYIIRCAFENWKLKTLILKSQDFTKEKKKKRKEKFKQRKIKRLNSGYYDNKKERTDENDFSQDSEEFEEEQKYYNNNSHYRYNNKKYYDEYYYEKYKK